MALNPSDFQAVLADLRSDYDDSTSVSLAYVYLCGNMRLYMTIHLIWVPGF